jgi:hypothetical protein
MSFFWLVYFSDERADWRRGFRPIYRDMIISPIELNTVHQSALEKIKIISTNQSAGFDNSSKQHSMS